MHPQPGSPKKPCKWTMTGRHQWAYLKTRPWRKSTVLKCWLCGARPAGCQPSDCCGDGEAHGN